MSGPETLDSWHEEKQSAWLYRVVAEVEPDLAKRKLFVSLAEAAEGQAALWASDVAKHGGALPRFRPTLRAQMVARLTRWLSPRRVRSLLIAMKVRGMSVYTQPPLKQAHPMPLAVSEIGRRHRRGGGNLRAAVFGVNDGLVSNTSLVLGVVGAGSPPALVLMTGVAGLLAGAFSMASGEWVSVRSQRELFERQIAEERAELERYPEEEAEELALIYHARGLTMEQAREMSALVFQNKDNALSTLAREELGLNPDDLGSAWNAAISSFLSFAAGALLPLVPLLVSRHAPLWSIAALGAGALFAIGAVLSLFTGRNAALGGTRMLLIGAAAGGATYGIGRAIGVGIG